MQTALMLEEEEETSKPSASNTNAKDKNGLSPKVEHKTVITPG